MLLENMFDILTESQVQNLKTLKSYVRLKKREKKSAVRSEPSHFE